MEQNGQNGWFRLENSSRTGRTAPNYSPRSYMERMQQMHTRTSQDRRKYGRDCTDGEMPDIMPQTAAEYQPRTDTRPAMTIPRFGNVQPPRNSQPPVSSREIKDSDTYRKGQQMSHSQAAGPGGSVLEQDGVLHETLETFVHSKLLERAVHVKGYGAFGFFQPYESMKAYTTLNFLQNPNQRTPTLSRFSLAVSNKGTPDTSRNVRGFSTKFYTPGGNFDLLCNHIPVFLVRDALRFPEAIGALSPSPVNNLMDSSRFWEFAARAPEATHFITWLYSDVGTIKSLRHLRAYGVNTYIWKNADGVRRYVKYHWIPVAGTEFIDAEEAAKLAGESPDIAGWDLYDTLARGETVEFELRVQLMHPDDAESLPYDPLDDTKIWSEEQFPLLPVGKLTLNRNPEDYKAQVEKLAFSPNNLLEGVELSDDKMLQGRANIYWDAQRRRLGPDFRSIPVNSEKGWTPNVVVTSGNGRHLDGTIQRSEIERTENFLQAGERYDSLSEQEREHLVRNIASELCTAPMDTRRTVLGYFRKASEDFAGQLEAAMQDQKE